MFYGSLFFLLLSVCNFTSYDSFDFFDEGPDKVVATTTTTSSGDAHGRIVIIVVGVSRIGEEGRNRRLVVDETSGGDQCRHWHPWPAGIGTMLMMAVVGFGLFHMWKENKEPKWFLFWRKGSWGWQLTTFCAATLLIVFGSFHFFSTPPFMVFPLPLLCYFSFGL